VIKQKHDHEHGDDAKDKPLPSEFDLAMKQNSQRGEVQDSLHGLWLLEPFGSSA